MTATMPIARRTTPHRPLGLRARWDAFRLRHSRRAQAAEFQRLHDALPLGNPDRHALDAPALEDAFAALAADHPEAVTPVDGGTLARDTNCEQLLLATCDAWFREAHPGPEHRWHPTTVASYQRLMDGVRGCFHPAGGAS
ncbi:hypothetical protein ACIQ9J_21685 [Streptomyces sp. NPDC094153]|uniref:hypothetical protein n=1 Tax=Streptomyces sp. NPDC094153 TaxID=3366058 RepID=UPI00382EEA20